MELKVWIHLFDLLTVSPQLILNGIESASLTPACAMLVLVLILNGIESFLVIISPHFTRRLILNGIESKIAFVETLILL